MDNDLNIIDVYLKNYGQMIILLLGMPTSNKSAIAKELESDIEPKFTLININNYLEKKFIDIEVRDIKFKLYDHPDNINYTKLLYDINEKKSSGVILYGNFIDPNKFKDIIIDFSYFFDLRHTYLKNNLIKKKLLPFDDEINNVSNIDIKNINVIKKNNHDTIEKSLITEKSSTTNNSYNIKSESDNTSTNSSDNTSNNSSDNTSSNSSDNTSSNSNDNTSTNSNDNTSTNSNDNTSTNSSDNSTNSSDNASKHKLNLKTDYEKKINRKLEIYIRDILLPIYNNIKENIKFNKYYNIKEDTDFNTIYDNLFDQFIYLIKKKLNQPLDMESSSKEDSSKEDNSKEDRSKEDNSKEEHQERNKKFLFQKKN